MNGAPWDTIIAGQGLAGTTLAWHLLAAGQRVLVLDAEAAITSSKIAAGLITPITGQRMALSWRIDEFMPVANEFYRQIEQRTGRRFFHDRTAVRLFNAGPERGIWAKRLLQPAYRTYIAPQPTPLLDSAIADTSEGGFVMRAAQLDVGAYLLASRTAFKANGSYTAQTIDWHRDVSFSAGDVSVQHHQARRLISCEGFAASQNPYFAHVPFNAAKGEILTVRFHRPMPCQSLHRGLWVAPTAEPDVFRAGSTYDWATLDQVPTAAARAGIERKLQAFLRVPHTVLEHQAAVRPVIHLSEALLGLHPQHEQLGYFNGLGSKGSLHAPWFAQRFTALLVHGVPLPEAQDIRKFS